MVVYSLPGGLPKKMVLVKVSQDHRSTMLNFQSLIASSFMPYAYKDGDKLFLPSIGDDYSKVELHTWQYFSTVRYSIGIGRAIPIPPDRR